jgi:hypothetical protein
LRNKLNKGNERIGETRNNNLGTKMEIIRYIDSNNIIVQFENNNYITNATYNQFCKGDIRNPDDKTIHNYGYIGIGNYEISVNKIHILRYKAWACMLERCYSPKFQSNHPTYKACTVCEEWLNYQNFAEWYNENYYEIENEKMQLDKDILIKGNKIYSPEACMFVPQSVNQIFVKRERERGKYPIGVYLNKKTNKYVSHCHNGNKQLHLGYFNTPEDAFNVYKEFKESYIKQVANKYKGRIPDRLYNALYMYKVHIDD